MPQAVCGASHLPSIHREAVLLVSGNKSGGGEDRFYKQLIARADKRYAAHLRKIKAVRKGR
jgi:hypothetical protein